jgi:hypothetical protein
MSEHETYMSHILAELHVGYLPDRYKLTQCSNNDIPIALRRVGSCGDIQTTGNLLSKQVDASTQTDVAEPST